SLLCRLTESRGRLWLRNSAWQPNWIRPLNWNALLQSRGDITTGVDLSVTEVLPQFATGATHSRSGESLSAALRLWLLGLDVSHWLGTALATTIAGRDQAPYRVLRCQRRACRARSDI